MAKEKIDLLQPFRDIPKFFKGFPKNIVHMWKDPVNSSEEVKARKKEIMPVMYLSVCLFIALFILIIFLPDISIILAIPLIGILYSGFLLMVAKKAAKKFADIECNKCKTRITFGDNVTFEVIDKKFTITDRTKNFNDKNGVPEKSTVEFVGEEKINVKIKCKCQECGDEKEFFHTFVSMRCNKNKTHVPYVQSGALGVAFKRDIENAYPQAFEGLGEIRPKSGELVVGGVSASSKTVGDGVNVTFNRSAKDLVEGYFGNDLN